MIRGITTVRRGRGATAIRGTGTRGVRRGVSVGAGIPGHGILTGRGAGVLHGAGARRGAGVPDGILPIVPAGIGAGAVRFTHGVRLHLQVRRDLIRQSVARVRHTVPAAMARVARRQTVPEIWAAAVMATELLLRRHLRVRAIIHPRKATEATTTASRQAVRATWVADAATTTARTTTVTVSRHVRATTTAIHLTITITPEVITRAASAPTEDAEAIRALTARWAAVRRAAEVVAAVADNSGAVYRPAIT